MKNVTGALFIVSIAVCFSCKKEGGIIPAIADKQLQFVQMWEKDTFFYIVPIPNPTTLRIGKDRSWNLEISGNITKGTPKMEQQNSPPAKGKI